MGLGYGGFEKIFLLIFAAAVGIFLVSALKGAAVQKKNRNSPRLVVAAKVVSLDADVTLHSHPNAGDPTGAHGYNTVPSAQYHVTFQVESGDTMEFSVTGSEYEKLKLGDSGNLSFQGTRYLSFERRK